MDYYKARCLGIHSSSCANPFNSGNDPTEWWTDLEVCTRYISFSYMEGLSVSI